MSFNVSGDHFFSALSSAATLLLNSYDIAKYNCTNFALDICAAANINFIPRTKGLLPFPFDYTMGLSPGNLGKDLRGLATTRDVNTTAGYSNSRKGPCD